MSNKLKFVQFVDLTTIGNSMLLEENTVVASLTGTNGEYVYINVSGYTNIKFNDEYYSNPADFPPELVDMLQTDNLNTDNVEVWSNNWFDVICDFDCEDAELANATTAEIYSLLAYTLNEKYGEDCVPASFDELEECQYEIKCNKN